MMVHVIKLKLHKLANKS